MLLASFVWFGIWFLFSSEPRDWLGRTSLKLPILCRLGRKTLLHAIRVTNTLEEIFLMLKAWKNKTRLKTFVIYKMTLCMLPL